MLDFFFLLFPPLLFSFRGTWSSSFSMTRELLLCRLLLLLRNLFCLLFLFPQMVDQPLHHLRANGALLVLGKDFPSRFLGGELCGPLKDEGF